MFISVGVAALLVLCQCVLSGSDYPLTCRRDYLGNIDIEYAGEGKYISLPSNSSSINQAVQNVTVCVFDGVTDARGTVRHIYHVVCEERVGEGMRTLSVTEGNRSELETCTGSKFVDLEDSKESLTDGSPRPIATLAVINPDGYIVKSVGISEMLRLRVQTLTDQALIPPIVGQCWYSLINKTDEERIEVESNVQFVQYGCSVQDENQLMMTNQDAFFVNGLMEKVSYPFDLMKLSEEEFNYLRFTCEVYFCKEKGLCWARCPTSQTTYQVSGFPLKLNLSTEVFVSFDLPTTESPTTRRPRIMRTRGTTPKPPEKKSALEKSQPLMLIGTLVVTVVILTAICGLVIKSFSRNRQYFEDRRNNGIFHTNVPVDDPNIYSIKDNQRLLKNLHVDQRYRNGYHGNPKLLENLHSPRSGSGQQNNQIFGLRGNIPSDQLTRHSAATPLKGPYPNLLSSSTSYISKSNIRSPPRSQGQLNYGYDDERINHVPHFSGHGKLVERTPQDLPALQSDPGSPVGGQLYPGNHTARELFRDKHFSHHLRQQRSETALLNNALREYFERHGMLH